MARAHGFRPGTAQKSSGRKLAGWIGLAAALSLLAAGSQPADARAKGHKRIAIHGASYRPPYAAIVVDDNSGQVLHESDPDGRRHPASLTKIMTLYLLFGELEAGKLALDSQLPISAHASVQNPTKMGLRPGQTIKVDDAIRGIVTKSANDAAVVVAEAIGGTEPDFAAMMTRKARALGMMNTTYVNASGLPADEQITTARDQALLGRAIQQRFPTYYSYFSLPYFQYRGRYMSNHNSLLRTVEGVDGIKTGYTEASGYNLVSSVRRGLRRMVSVVLGGRSNGARDQRMRELIEQYIARASEKRTAALIVEHEEAGPDVAAAAPVDSNVVPTADSSAAPEPVNAALPASNASPEPATALLPTSGTAMAALPGANFSLQSVRPTPTPPLFEGVP